MESEWDLDDGLPEPPAWPEDAEIPLCPHCLHETRMGAHFCHRCLAPLTFYAATGWLERTWAWPWVVGETLHTRWPRLLHPLGVTILFGLEILGAGGLILTFAWTAEPGERLLGVLYFLLVAAALPVVYVVKAWRNWARHHDEDPWAGNDDGGLPGEPAAPRS